jgi:hypothetical protein
MVRTVALVGAITVGMLCDALICQPAQAQNYSAFGSLPVNAPAAILTIVVGGVSYELTTDSFQGWISSSAPNNSGHGANTSYFTGVLNGRDYLSYFDFDLANPVCEVSNTKDCITLPTTATVTSATLTVSSGKVTRELDYNVFGATTAISELENPTTPNTILSPISATVFKNLTSGTAYSSTLLFSTSTSTNLIVNLSSATNNSAINDINSAIKNRTTFGVVGQVEPVPEPSTWIMMVAGFVGLGVVARRRAARRPAAASTG